VSGLTAGPASGAHDGGEEAWGGGTPPPVLLAALGAALLIAITLVVLFGGFSSGGDDGGTAEPIGAEVTAPPTATATRAVLKVTLTGDGEGAVTLAPGDISCDESCEHRFDTGERVTVTADPDADSTFEGFGDACDGTKRCSVVIDGTRALTVLFASRPDEPAAPPPPPPDPVCDDPVVAAEDPACADDEIDPPADDPAPTTRSDCNDGRDNDGDGLTDRAQDPNCAAGGNESGSTASPGATTIPRTPPPPPPPARPVNDCTDGEDNDRDGLTDRAQDPDCVTGRSEIG